VVHEPENRSKSTVTADTPGYTQTVDRVVDQRLVRTAARRSVHLPGVHHRHQSSVRQGGPVSESPADPTDLNHAWQRAYEILHSRGNLGAAQAGFIRLTKPLGVIDDTILLAVPSEFAKDYIETRARESIISALSTALDRTVRIAVTVDPSLEDQDEAS